MAKPKYVHVSLIGEAKLNYVDIVDILKLTSLFHYLPSAVSVPSGCVHKQTQDVPTERLLVFGI